MGWREDHPDQPEYRYAHEIKPGDIIRSRVVRKGSGGNLRFVEEYGTVSSVESWVMLDMVSLHTDDGRVQDLHMYAPVMIVE